VDPPAVSTRNWGGVCVETVAVKKRGGGEISSTTLEEEEGQKSRLYVSLRLAEHQKNIGGTSDSAKSK